MAMARVVGNHRSTGSFMVVLRLGPRPAKTANTPAVPGADSLRSNLLCCRNPVLASRKLRTAGPLPAIAQPAAFISSDVLTNRRLLWRILPQAPRLAMGGSVLATMRRYVAGTANSVSGEFAY